MSPLKLVLLAIPIVIVDVATFSNVYEAYSFFEHPLQAILVAIAFAFLQIGSLVLFSQTLPGATHRWLFVGAAVLLGVTGLANVMMAFLRAKPILPVDGLIAVFGATPGQLLVALSWIFGLVLVVAGLIFWSAFGIYVQTTREAQKDIREEQRSRLQRMAQYDAVTKGGNGMGDLEQVKQQLQDQLVKGADDPTTDELTAA